MPAGMLTPGVKADAATQALQDAAHRRLLLMTGQARITRRAHKYFPTHRVGVNTVRSPRACSTTKSKSWTRRSRGGRRRRRRRRRRPWRRPCRRRRRSGPRRRRARRWRRRPRRRPRCCRRRSAGCRRTRAPTRRAPRAPSARGPPSASSPRAPLAHSRLSSCVPLFPYSLTPSYTPSFPCALVQARQAHDVPHGLRDGRLLQGQEVPLHGGPRRRRRLVRNQPSTSASQPTARYATATTAFSASAVPPQRLPLMPRSRRALIGNPRRRSPAPARNYPAPPGCRRGRSSARARRGRRPAARPRD